ncbi:MAG: winged helix-turn-helix transcriptional regulator [Candidatus Diapherotrites archaeon]|nr:winged helix-turn-helix transcriptional regulator [Candidatus Diapherotrites archaeon]
MKSVPYHLCFETLGNDLRIRILAELAKKPMSVQTLVSKTGAQQSTVSHALAELRNCNFVVSTAEGKQRIYTLNPNVAKEIENTSPGTPAFLSIMEKHFKEHCKGRCRKIE